MFTALASKLEIITPGSGFDWDAFARTPLHAAFAPETVAFLDMFSKRLLNDPQCLRFPDLAALGFWLRGAHIRKLAENYQAGVMVGRGTVFHLAPGNVDTLFVYSLVLGLLAGNRNVIRLGQRETPQQKLLLELLCQELKAHPELAERVLMVRYGHDDEITGFFSAHCQVRVIWGGDATVNAIRRLPLPPGSGDLAFAGRFSLAVIAGESFDERTVSGFVTDCFSFGQQGCSSPKLVVYLGSSQVARENFWAAVELEWRKRGFGISPAEAMSRWNDANDTAMLSDHPVVLKQAKDKQAFLRLELSSWDQLQRELNHGNGLFFELEAASPEEVLAHCEESDQTMVSIGIPAERWRSAIAAVPPKGIARIVPAGKALEFAPVWDGHDLIAEMSRNITV